ncbi:hypothetical protein ACIO6U_02830 [Streptomyces sp. NPDC087422]|uniref:hypothetical protein n=1 Tax=Streptomyces sp. NPDC087422 TaxID=3365786 RepID=UPI0038032956
MSDELDATGNGVKNGVRFRGGLPDDDVVHEAFAARPLPSPEEAGPVHADSPTP